MMNYNVFMRKKVEEKIKKQEKELALLQDMASRIKEHLTALMVEEMGLHSMLRNMKESKEDKAAASPNPSAAAELKAAEEGREQLHLNILQAPGELEGLATLQAPQEEEEEEEDEDSS